MRVKDKVLFESKEYGIGGHNKLELRMVEDEPRVWIRDGDTNAAICLDRADVLALGVACRVAGRTAAETVQLYDFTKPIRKKNTTTSETNGVKKKRKTRSDKGKKRVKNAKG